MVPSHVRVSFKSKGQLLGATLWALCALAGCQPRPVTTETPFLPAGDFVVDDLRAPGGSLVRLVVRGGKIAPDTLDDDLPRVDGGGAYVVPGLIDSHVHFQFLDGADAFATQGFVAAVDLAAPLASLSDAKHAPLEVLNAGPMITSLQGYPTQSWGRGGFGFQVRSAATATAAAENFITHGARVLKIPLDGDEGLDDAQARAVVEVAHRHGVLVVAHALSDAGARRAAVVGVDVLGHTPTERLADETVAAWATKTVISTLAAFGGDNRENLQRLHAAGARVLYGTDFGNLRTPGVSTSELEDLAAAGLTPADILAAMTTTPASVWGLSRVGSLEAGKDASFLLVASDPLDEVGVLARPLHVVYQGRERR